MPADRPVALDEYPIHQAPLSMKHLVSGDRNAYDRCIFHVFDHAGRAVLILGLGVYPNAGVIDAYATLRVGDELLAVRASDALGDDRMNLSVGPLSVTVDVPLKQLTLRCAPDPADPHGLSYDVTWTAEFPAVWEPHHIQRRGDRLMLEGRRFVQAGNVTGTVRAKGEEFVAHAGGVDRHPRPELGRASDPRGGGGPRGRGAPPRGLPLALGPGPLRGPLRDGDRPGGRRRPPHPERGRAGLPRGQRAPRRPARLAAHRDPLPVREPSSRERRRPPHRPGPQAPRTGRGDTRTPPRWPSAPATRPPPTGSTAPGRAAAGPTAASTTSPTPRPTRWPPSG